MNDKEKFRFDLIEYLTRMDIREYLYIINEYYERINPKPTIKKVYFLSHSGFCELFADWGYKKLIPLIQVLIRFDVDHAFMCYRQNYINEFGWLESSNNLDEWVTIDEIVNYIIEKNDALGDKTIDYKLNVKQNITGDEMLLLMFDSNGEIKKMD
jgi:hypothetical protein